MNIQSGRIITSFPSCATLALLLALGAGCFNDPGALIEGSGGASASGGTSLHGVARAQTTTKTFIDYLQPTPITCSPLSSATWGVAGVLPRDLCNGIESTNGAGVAPTYLYWDGQIIAGKDGTYHMFMSTWADSLGFNPGWTNSESYHAASTHGC